MPPPK
jgi:hypothetical protein